MEGNTYIVIKLAMDIIGLVLQTNPIEKGDFAPTSAMEQV